MTDLFIDHKGAVHELPGFYEDFEQRFQLVHRSRSGSEAVLVIQEPAGWNKISFLLERDPEAHGVDSEESSKETPLSYDGYSGRDFIEAIRLSEGPGAIILLQQGIVVNGVFLIEYEGRLDFTKYNRTRRRVSCGLIRNSLKRDVLARWDTKLNLFGQYDLDNKPMDGAAGKQYQLPLSGQALSERFYSNSKAGRKIEQAFLGDTNGHVWIQFDTSEPEVSDIADLATGKTLGLSESEGPVHYKEWLFKFRSGGKRKVSISLSYRFWASVKKRTISVGKALVTGWDLQTVLVLKKANGTEQRFNVLPTAAEGIFATPANKKYGQADVSKTVTGTFTQELDTAAGDELYLFGLWRMRHNKNELQQTQVQVTVLQCLIDISGITSNKSTSAPAITPETAFQVGIQMLTGLEDRFRSNFYGLAGERYAQDGCGSLAMLSSGKLIRGIPYDERSIAISIRDLTNSFKAIHNIGMEFGYAPDAQGNIVDVVHVEPAEAFYRNVELLRIEDVADYSEEMNPDQLFSRLEVGYEKSITEGQRGREEMHAKMEASTPLKAQAASYERRSMIVASGLALELTRREQFSDKPKDSTDYDENIFVIQSKRIESYSGGVRFKPLIFQIVEVDQAIPWLVPGMIITFPESVLNSGQFTVTAVSDPLKSPWTFNVDRIIKPETLPNAQIISENVPMQPETGLDFAAVAGSATASGAYNLRHTPGRMLFRHRKIWGCCLDSQPATAQVIKTVVPVGGERLSTRLPSTDACDEMVGGSLVEAAPIDADVVQVSNPHFAPYTIRFSTRLSRSAVQRLRVAMQGRLAMETDEQGQPIDRNRGYITFPDESGNLVEGWISKLEWGPFREKAVFEIQKKPLALDSSSNCAQFLGITVEQAESLPDDLRRKLELCRFIDVDDPL
ncbi:hypothetical protein [Tellurirhabdus bombi]|uniref:hypothetical protein n=1 Tax=Tellurirhabdus bombi TaxID=2907205 RepID=UPI001F2CA6C8|nr:hypothetical protein [Tellurirhabdus bombi]